MDFIKLFLKKRFGLTRGFNWEFHYPPKRWYNMLLDSEYSTLLHTHINVLTSLITNFPYWKLTRRVTCSVTEWVLGRSLPESPGGKGVVGLILERGARYQLVWIRSTNRGSQTLTLNLSNSTTNRFPHSSSWISFSRSFSFSEESLVHTQGMDLV